jgi:hypothetical protein
MLSISYLRFTPKPPSGQNYFRSDFEGVKSRITCERLEIDLTRLTNAHEQSRRNTLKPTWQDFSARNFDICGFTGVIIVVLNTKFKLVSFCTIIFAAFV